MHKPSQPPTNQWSFGDKVGHSAKPEWGAGVVTAALGTQHEGKPCQSLTIRFDRAGVKTISTAFARLVHADRAGGLLVAEPEPERPAMPGYSDAPETLNDPSTLIPRDPREIMTRLPDEATDPFATPLGRLAATLKLYRFAPTGGSILDWAAVQSGLADPLSRFNRHELERFFEGFAAARDGHLKKLVLELRRSDPAGLRDAAAKAPPAALPALRRLDAGR
jgi:hypothetical protein